MPRRVKYRKAQRGRLKGKSLRCNRVDFGEYGLQALSPCWITARQIEAARTTIIRAVKRGGRLWIRIFPDKPITQKPTETRMGKGKGVPSGWVAHVKRGRVLFELAGIPESLAKRAFQLAGYKLPTKTKFLYRTSE
jgi:large subunit ribosomal protein L16